MMKEYLQRFISDESGMEFMQLAIVVAATAGLIVVVQTLMGSVSSSIEYATDEVDKQLNNASSN